MEPIILVGVVFLIPATVVGIAFLVHQDAERIGMENPDKWFGIVVLSGGSGLLLYLLERDDQQAALAAPEGAEFPLPGMGITPERSDADTRQTTSMGDTEDEDISE